MTAPLEPSEQSDRPCLARPHDAEDGEGGPSPAELALVLTRLLARRRKSGDAVQMLICALLAQLVLICIVLAFRQGFASGRAAIAAVIRSGWSGPWRGNAARLEKMALNWDPEEVEALARAAEAACASADAPPAPALRPALAPTRVRVRAPALVHFDAPLRGTFGRGLRAPVAFRSPFENDALGGCAFVRP